MRGAEGGQRCGRCPAARALRLLAPRRSLGCACHTPRCPRPATCRPQIYVPRLPGIPSDYPYFPDAFHLAYEDVWLTTADGLRLHAWLMWPRHWGPDERQRRPTVLFFQENAGNMAFR